MNVKWLLVLTVPVVAILAAVIFFSQNKRGDISINWENKSTSGIMNTSYIQVPEGKYNDTFSEILGPENWETAKLLYRKQAGITSFMPGDIFSMTTDGGRLVSFGLHNYKNRSAGEKISFRKKGGRYIKELSELTLEVKTVVKYFTVKKSFPEDDPLFYAMAKERLVWDWGILDKLMPGDSVSFMIKGIFDKDILVYTFGILGFSVRSVRMGDFTLTAFRDTFYGDYFVTGSRMMLSPQGQFRTPIDSGRITSYFGFRKDPFNNSKRFHNGVDIIAKTDTPVRAADSGTVNFAGVKGNYGNTIVLDHGDGIKTMYAHLNRYLVASGQTVAKGEVIAGAGNSGRSTSAHLHFSVLVDGKQVDPLQYTYERIWYAPFDISGEFRSVSVSRAIQLEEAMDKKKSLSIKEQFANLSPVN